MRRQAFLIYSSTVNENRTTCACAGGYFRQKTLKIYPLGANKKPPKIPNTEFTLDSSSLASLSGEASSTPVENVRQIRLFLQNKPNFPPFFTQKQRFHQKTNPIQTQYKPNVQEAKK